MESYQIRQSTGEDAGLIALHRRLMFTDQGEYPAEAMDKMEAEYAHWVRDKLAAGEYVAWFAESADGTVVASVGLWLREWPPILNDATGRQGYIENVYTAPAHRRQGLSRQLMHALLNWVRKSKTVHLIELHASEAALPLYASLGFKGEEGMMQLWVG